MNERIAAILVATALPAAALGQVPLQAGDVWTYEFNSLPELISTAGFEMGGGFTVLFGDYDTGTDRIAIDMYEDSLMQPSLFSAISAGESEGLFVPNAWADHQGIGRLEVLSGQMTIELVEFFHQFPDGNGGWQSYRNRFVPTVPEPGTLGLLASVLLLTFIRPARDKS